MLFDDVKVCESLGIALKSGDRKILSRWYEEPSKSVVEVRGWVSTLLRERGKVVPGSRREGHNIWTNTGREYLSMLMTLQVAGNPGTPYRNDRIAYIGVGAGAQVEDPGVVSLVQPIEFQSGQFLASIDVASTSFPLLPSRTTVRYVRNFGENEITVPPLTKMSIRELGLFTNGDQNSFNPGSRNTTIGVASLQSPCAYKNLGEPVEKTSGLEFEVTWEIRF